MGKRILIIDDESSMLDVIEAMLINENYQVVTFEDARAGIAYYRDHGAHLVICDIRMEPIDGIAVLQEIRGINPDAAVILITAYSNVQDAMQAMKIGAFDYLQKPFKMEKLRSTVRRALTMQKIVSEEKDKQDSQEESNFNGIVSRNKVIKQLFEIVKKVAPTKTTVLLQGESGTGKELFARAIHTLSKGDDASFVAVNCGALPEHLLESELFGHVKGSFTGAVQDKDGLFVAAGNGSLFLDEIDALSLALQTKLLRVLQEKEIRPVGSVKSLKVECRVIVSSNRSLEKLVSQNRFREDLYYRLNVIPIEIPPLRERMDDLLLLIQYFFKKMVGDAVFHISPPALSLLLEYGWPGNVRELENTIERVTTLCADGHVTVEDLPEFIRRRSSILHIVPTKDVMSLKEFTTIAQGQYIVSVLQKFGQDKTQATRYLEIDILTLNRKLERFQNLKENPASN